MQHSKTYSSVLFFMCKYRLLDRSIRMLVSSPDPLPTRKKSEGKKNCVFYSIFFLRASRGSGHETICMYAIYRFKVYLT